MNSYNENLHSTVVATLLAQEQEQKNMKASLDASMFTLYYAGGARMTAAEKLNSAQEAYDHQQKLNEQAVINNNISVNLLTSANQEKQYVAQSVTNTSVAAANIQAASNAVLKLAGNVGSIFSMVSAADYDSDIYLQSKEANRLMNQTAFDAEQVSQLAMEASTLTAEVSASALADETKAANEEVNNLYKVISANFVAVSAVVAADNAVLASTSATEKVAEGNLEAINVEYYAARNAYTLNNKELNIDLKVPEVTITSDAYTVSFNYYTSPFKQPKANGEENSTSAKDGYPVNNYYIMLVKDNQKSTFALSNAESLVATDDDTRYLKFSGKHDGTVTGDVKEIFISEIRDSDGDTMIPGVNYVVFIMAELMTEYKKTINDFSDYLSAPSATFTLTNKLSSPEPEKINMNGLELTFELEEYSAYTVDYRCMFLPDNKRLTKGLLSEQGLRSIEKEVERLEKIAELYDPMIEALQVSITTEQSDLISKQAELREVKDEIANAPAKEKPALVKKAAEITKEINGMNAEINKKKKELERVTKRRDAAIGKLDPSVETSPGFFFNLTIAEQVSPANYNDAEIATDGKDNPSNGKRTVRGKLAIKDNFTDNFGNQLIEGYSYIPVILSFASPLTQDVQQFTNSLSDYANTNNFVYKPELLVTKEDPESEA